MAAQKNRAPAKASPRQVGRPSKYRDEFPEQARKLCLLGATDEDMARFFEVATSTVKLWAWLATTGRWPRCWWCTC